MYITLVMVTFSGTLSLLKPSLGPPTRTSEAGSFPGDLPDANQM